MSDPRPVCRHCLFLLGAACLAGAPAPALAHASERMIILTLPTGHYIAGAAAAVALTALLAVALPRLPSFAPQVLFRRPVILSRTVTSWWACAVLMGLVATGIFGSHDPYGNLLPLTLWTGIWVGLTVLSVFFGNLWQNLEPWRGPVRFLRRGIGWRGSIGLGRWGHWPAVIGYLAFAWFEIVSLAPDNPQQLAAVVLIYWLVILALAVAEGEDWLVQGEFLTVYFGFIARIAPFWSEKRGGRLAVMAGLPGAQVLAMPPLPASAIAFVLLVLASVSFDGLSETFWWLARIGINPLEFPGRSAVMGVNSAGLIALWGLSAATILGAITLGLVSGGVPRDAALRSLGPLALSFLPIAAGYHIAHYFVALLTGGQYFVAALSDPFGQGWDIFGLGAHWVSFGYMAQTGTVRAIWNCQFAVILGAHMLALVLGHKLGDRIGGATGFRAHLPLTLLMILYTVLGLWLLAAPAAG